MEIPLYKIIFWAIDALIKRSILFALVIFGINFLSKKNPKLTTEAVDSTWDSKSVYSLLFSFLIIEYSAPFLLGGIFYRDFSAFFVKTPIWRNNLAGLLFVSFILVTTLYIVKYKYRQPLSKLGFQKNRLRYGLIWGFGVLLFFGSLFVCIKYFRAISPSSDYDQVDLLWILSSTIIGPIAEEVFHRGYVYPNFRKRIGRTWGILLSSICFVALHQEWKEWPSILISGIVFCFMYEKSGSLIAPIMGHIFRNTFSMMISYRSGAIIYLIPWPIIWVFLAVTSVIYFLILKSTSFAPDKTISNILPGEIRKLTIEDSEEIIRNATRKGWMVALILGVALMFFLYFYKR